MKSAAPPGFDPLLVGSVILVCVVLIVIAASSPVMRTARIILETGWLYVSSTRG